MARLSVAAILLAAAALTRAVTPNTPSILPGAYIVEYEDDHVSPLWGMPIMDCRN